MPTISVQATYIRAPTQIGISIWYLLLLFLAFHHFQSASQSVSQLGKEAGSQAIDLPVRCYIIAFNTLSAIRESVVRPYSLTRI